MLWYSQNWGVIQSGSRGEKKRINFYHFTVHLHGEMMCMQKGLFSVNFETCLDKLSAANYVDFAIHACSCVGNRLHKTGRSKIKWSPNRAISKRKQSTLLHALVQPKLGCNPVRSKRREKKKRRRLILHHRRPLRLLSRTSTRTSAKATNMTFVRILSM